MTTMQLNSGSLSCIPQMTRAQCFNACYVQLRLVSKAIIQCTSYNTSQVDLNSQTPGLSFEVIIVDKTATRLAEATMFSFIPNLQESNQWQDRLYKVQSPDTPTEQPYFSVFSVVKNGSFYQHAVEQVSLVEQLKSGTLNLGFTSSDVPLVCPIFVGEAEIVTPTPFPYLQRPRLATSVDGFAFNIHNNIWNTNYPLWYPFTEEDKTFKARFKMTISE